jgi:hypothetical protein
MEHEARTDLEFMSMMHKSCQRIVYNVNNIFIQLSAPGHCNISIWYGTNAFHYDYTGSLYIFFGIADNQRLQVGSLLAEACFPKPVYSYTAQFPKLPKRR